MDINFEAKISNDEENQDEENQDEENQDEENQDEEKNLDSLNSETPCNLAKKFYYKKKFLNNVNCYYESYLLGLKETHDFLRRQYEYAQYSMNNFFKKEFKRGEIYEVDWGINVGAEFSFRHYAIVLKDSSQFDPLVLVCPLKSNKHGAHPKSDINLGIINGLNSTVTTLAVVNQIKTIDKLRICSHNIIGESRKKQMLQEESNNIPSMNGFNENENVKNSNSGNAITRLDERVVKEIINAYTNFIFFDSIIRGGRKKIIN